MSAKPKHEGCIKAINLFKVIFRMPEIASYSFDLSDLIGKHEEIVVTQEKFFFWFHHKFDRMN